MALATVAVVAFDGISPFHLSVPCVVLGEDRREDGIPRYDVSVCALEKGTVSTNSGFSIHIDHDVAAIERAGTVIVPSWRSPSDQPPKALLDALHAAHGRGARIVGLCLGAFVVAAAGLLDGRKATTHWRYAHELMARYPAIKVEPEVLWVDYGDVITSAGTAAAIDCCLHLVRGEHGAEIANRLARRLVIAPRRSGSQAQYIEHPAADLDAPDSMDEILVWMRQHFDQPLVIDELAARVHFSRRGFTRHFRAATGTSPRQWLLAQRIALAQSLLETTDLPIERIAERSGMGSAVSLRQQFQHVLNTSPQAYRRAFALTSGGRTTHVHPRASS